MWVTQADEKASQADVVKNIMRLRRGGPLDHHDEEHCGRGLEHMRSQAHMDQRRANKEAVTHGVLDLQDEHFEADVFDEAALAEVGASASLWARERAFQLAAQDEAYVRLHVRPEYEEEAQMERDRQQQQDQEDSVDQLQILEEALVLSESEEDQDQDDHRAHNVARPRSASSTLAQDNLIINATPSTARASAADTDSFLDRISSRTFVPSKARAEATRERSNGRREMQDAS